LRYNRCRFFTLLFFMQNLSVKSINQFNKSCRVFHEESNETGFPFFRFFYDFLCISMFQPICFAIEDSNFQPGPWKDFGPHIYTLGSQKRPWKEVAPCNVVLGGSRRWSGLKSGEGSPESGRERAEGGPRDYQGPVCGRRRKQGVSGELGR
jgi:hypothetical protein